MTKGGVLEEEEKTHMKVRLTSSLCIYNDLVETFFNCNHAACDPLRNCAVLFWNLSFPCLLNCLFAFVSQISICVVQS